MANVIALFLTAISSVAAASTLTVPVDKVYVPEGFSSGEMIQFVSEFQRPSACYNTEKTSVEVDSNSRVVRLTQRLTEREGFCTQAVETMRRDLNLGPLPDGFYEIFDSVSGLQLGSFEVSGARPELNRMVTITATHSDLSNGILEIQGQLPSSCTEVRTVRAVHDRVDVIVVYPRRGGARQGALRT
ncbi:MAG: hypothetical protein ABL958_10530, partial [Bdellovibrionia bacterium]